MFVLFIAIKSAHKNGMAIFELL